MYGFCFSLAGGLSPLVMGKLVDKGANPAAGYLISGVLLAAAATLLWVRTDRDVGRLASSA
ncbi:hypothetical protein [Streptomyces sp. bgisy031]|uniref:hypothetical protein n=1 Tax=Streptomyces sp. bgisy031 TaxID=3413772 RepID=UPI003D754311